MVRYRRQQAGQSIVLFALMMVFIIGMVGLSVDVGNAFGRERTSQNGANAAALAGMNSILVPDSTNEQVWNNVKQSLAGNSTDGANYHYWADYILSDNTKQPLGEWNGSDPVVFDGHLAPPNNVKRIQVTVKEQVDTFFVRAFGREQFTLTVNGNSCMGGYNMGVVPIGVPLNLLRSTIIGGTPQPYHRIFNANGSELATSDADWGVWDKMVNRSIRLPIENWTSSMAGSHVAWLNWTGTNELAPAMTFPGTLQLGFAEGPAMDARLPNSAPAGKLTLGDWVIGDTGVKGSLQDEMLKLAADNRDVGMPMYDTAGNQDGTTSFHVVRMGYFRISSVNMGSNPFLTVTYLGDKHSTATECAGEPDVPPPTPKLYKISGTANLNRVWGSDLTGATSYDIVIVMDRSGSMSYDWQDDRPEDTANYAYPRMNDARVAVRDFVRNYDLTKDPDARMSFVTFGGTGSTAVTQEVGWATSGCTMFQITSTLCTDDMKWAPIQSRAENVQTDGWTPGPLAFEQAKTLLGNRRTPPAGKNYGQIVLFATDGVFNVCGNYIDPGPVTSACTPQTAGEQVPFDGSYPGTGNEADYYLNNPGYNQMPGRPIWQAQQVAMQIKSELGARIFVVALTPRGGAFSPAGLPEMSSGGNDYYFQADDANTLANIYTRIDQQLLVGDCLPFEKKSPVGGVTVTLSQPGNPNADVTTTTDANGNFRFTDLVDGSYTVEVQDRTLTSPEDGISRTYSRIINANNPSEEGKLSIDLSRERPNGSISRADILWTMPLGDNGAPLNGCP